MYSEGMSNNSTICVSCFNPKPSSRRSKEAQLWNKIHGQNAKCPIFGPFENSNMPIYQLPETDLWFPDPGEFEEDVVAIGGDLSPERLTMAYSLGIFPWYNEPKQIVWWCPEERCIIKLDELKISHSMRNLFNKNSYKVTMDKDFRGVLDGCRSGDREGATWLLDEMVEAYEELHAAGVAHSVEVWHQEKLVGGLYGLSLGHVFYGESMFSGAPNSSKYGFISLVQFLKAKNWKFIDCQVFNDHLGSLGAAIIERQDFLELLHEELQHETIVGSWSNDFQLFMSKNPGVIK